MLADGVAVAVCEAVSVTPDEGEKTDDAVISAEPDAELAGLVLAPGVGVGDPDCVGSAEPDPPPLGVTLEV